MAEESTVCAEVETVVTAYPMHAAGLCRDERRRGEEDYICGGDERSTRR